MLYVSGWSNRFKYFAFHNGLKVLWRLEFVTNICSNMQSAWVKKKREKAPTIFSHRRYDNVANNSRLYLTDQTINHYVWPIHGKTTTTKQQKPHVYTHWNISNEISWSELFNAIKLWIVDAFNSISLCCRDFNSPSSLSHFITRIFSTNSFNFIDMIPVLNDMLCNTKLNITAFHPFTQWCRRSNSNIQILRVFFIGYFRGTLIFDGCLMINVFCCVSLFLHHRIVMSTR